MRTVSFVIFTAAILALPVSCAKEDCGCGLPADQPVVFEYRYINHAWGYQERGWFMDGAGAVHYYDSPVEYVSPDSTGLITRAGLIHNLTLADSVIASVDPEELAEFSSLIPAAAEGMVAEAEHAAYDAGTSVLSCYLYDPEVDAYRYVFLAMSGDFSQVNTSKAAEEIVDWLLELPIFWLSR